MSSNIELSELFLKELKQYNTTNFKKLINCNVEDDDFQVHKAFSSVVTRFFIFAEKHPEISDVSIRILYYKLNIDLISQYFTQYPDMNPDLLKPFQLKVKDYSQRISEASNVQSVI